MNRGQMVGDIDLFKIIFKNILNISRQSPTSAAKIERKKP